MVLVVLTAYMGRRLITPARLSRRANQAAWLGLGLCAALVPTALTLWRLHRGGMGQSFSQVGFVAAGFLLTVLVLLVARDMAVLALWGADGLSGKWTGKRILPAPKDRRARLLTQSSIALVGIALGCVVLGYVEAKGEARLERVTIRLPALPAEFRGYRIAQITDVHLGPSYDGKRLAALVARINALEPDVVAITGDLVEASVDQLRAEVAPLAQLKARDGVLFVLGNHEYYVGADDWVTELRALGITVLMNEHRVVERGNARLLIGGVPNAWGGMHGPDHGSETGAARIASDPAAALADAPPSITKILLAHQPASAVAAERAGFDLMLCGHTHGGQFFPWNLLARLGFPYLSGLQHQNKMQVYISRGVGVFGPPLRLGVPPELTLIELASD